MNRLKYRAFNTKTNKMVSSEKLKNISVFALIEGISPNSVIILPLEKHWILLQTTGLFDTSKNKKEIFDGDIVRIEIEYDTMYSEFPETSKINLEIKQKESGAWGIWNHFINEFEKPELYNSECILVGNIYENPELISKQYIYNS